MKKEKQVRVLIFEPKKPAREEIIPNELKEFQKIVGGLIEVVRVKDDVILLCNEEFLFMDFEPNRVVNGTVIHGTFLLIADVAPEFGSLSDKAVEFFGKR